MEDVNKAIGEGAPEVPTVADKHEEYEDAVFIALELGERILKCGGEVIRAEDTVERICRAYGAVNVDVIAILSTIVLTAEFEGESITSTRRVYRFGTTNLGKLSRLNDLSRRICRERPTKKEVIDELNGIKKTAHVNMWRYVIGSMLTSFGFAVFFSDFSAGITTDILMTCIGDGFLSALIALPLAFIARHLYNTKTNSVIAKFLICFLGGVAAMLVGKVFLQCHVDKIMIGNIMNVIPGVAMTNAFRDMFSGDIMSGVFRLCGAIVDAVAIAAGYAVAILLLGGLA